jgi:secreted trypsin-like serine protease
MLRLFIVLTSLSAFSRVSGKLRDDCLCGVANTESRRITNGVELKTLKYPWMVRILNQHHKVFCGGALVSDQLILTASHCVSFE